jgi:hypothetical protein
MFVPDPDFSFLDLGFQTQGGSKRHRIPNQDPQQWIGKEFKYFYSKFDTKLSEILSPLLIGEIPDPEVKKALGPRTTRIRIHNSDYINFFYTKYRIRNNAFYLICNVLYNLYHAGADRKHDVPGVRARPSLAPPHQARPHSHRLRHGPVRQLRSSLSLLFVFRIRIHVFLDHPDPNPLVRGMEPDPDPALGPDPDPSIIKQI